MDVHDPKLDKPVKVLSDRDKDGVVTDFGGVAVVKDLCYGPAVFEVHCVLFCVKEAELPHVGANFIRRNHGPVVYDSNTYFDHTSVKGGLVHWVRNLTKAPGQKAIIRLNSDHSIDVDKIFHARIGHLPVSTACR